MLGNSKFGLEKWFEIMKENINYFYGKFKILWWGKLLLIDCLLWF